MSRWFAYAALVLCAALVGVGIGYSIGTTEPVTTAVNGEPCTVDDSVLADTAVTSLPQSSDGNYTVRVTYHIDDGVSNLRVASPPSNIENVTNGTHDSKQIRFEEGVRTASFTFSSSVGSDQSSGIPQYSEGRWLLFNPPKVETKWTHEGSLHCVDAFSSRENNRVEANGLTTIGVDELTYATNKTTSSETYSLAQGHEVTIVTPERADKLSDKERDEIGHALGNMSHSFNVGCHRNVTMFALPERQIGASGLALNVGDESGVWVTHTRGPTTSQSTWLHEYVHARQCINPGEEMVWFKEASANYFRTSTAHQMNDEMIIVPFSSIRPQISENVVLSDRDTWETGIAPYYKGARVLLWLDAEIRRHSDQTLEDVFRWMNQHEGEVTYSEFRARVLMLTDEETAEQLDEYTHEDGRVPYDMEDARYIVDDNDEETYD